MPAAKRWIEAKIARIRGAGGHRGRIARPLLGVALVGAAVIVGFALRAGGDELSGDLIGAEAGIREVNHTYRASTGDVNGDGHEDLVVVPHFGDFPRIHVNRGDGTFEDIAETSFPPELVGPRDRHDCPIGDVTGDGRADIFCTTGGKGGGTDPSPSELWVQQEDGSFERSRNIDGFELGPGGDRWGRTRDALLIDVDGDGHLDLYTQNAYPRQDGRSPASRLFINEGGERFVNAGRHGFTGANVALGGNNLQGIDYDGDGWEDIVACGKGGVFVFRNLEGEDFRQIIDRDGGDMRCRWAEVADLGGDAPSLVRLDDDALSVHRRDGPEGFGPPVFRRALRHGEAFATGDVNGDGLDDIYVVRQGPTSSSGEPASESGDGVDDDRPDVMLINQGDGTEFEKQQPIPQLKRGRGNGVTAIDHDGDGRAAFVVLNGHRKARGPIQLLAFSGG